MKAGSRIGEPVLPVGLPSLQIIRVRPVLNLSIINNKKCYINELGKIIKKCIELDTFYHCMLPTIFFFIVSQNF